MRESRPFLSEAPEKDTLTSLKLICERRLHLASEQQRRRRSLDGVIKPAERQTGLGGGGGGCDGDTCTRSPFGLGRVSSERDLNFEIRRNQNWVKILSTFGLSQTKSPPLIARPPKTMKT